MSPYMAYIRILWVILFGVQPSFSGWSDFAGPSTFRSSICFIHVSFPSEPTLRLGTRLRVAEPGRNRLRSTKGEEKIWDFPKSKTNGFPFPLLIPGPVTWGNHWFAIHRKPERKPSAANYGKPKLSKMIHEWWTRWWRFHIWNLREGFSHPMTRSRL